MNENSKVDCFADKSARNDGGSVNSSENSKVNSANLANSAKGVNLKVNSNENSTANSANSVNLQTNSSPNSNSGSNFGSNLKAIFVLSKWAKVFLVALTAVAAVGLGAAFSLKIWASDKIESGEIVLKGIDRGAQERLYSGFAYQNRLYFARLDFLLRSKVIAYIDIQGISWAEGVDKNAVSDISSHNRWVKFATTQDLISQNFNDKNLGKVEYKMDFSPFFKTIIKYYLIIALCFYALLVLFQATFGTTKFKQISSYLSQTPLPSVLWQGYKNINPLYRHTFWIVFIALNLVFGFHTVQFLWGDHDWQLAFSKIDGPNYIWIGRYTEDAISLTLQMFMILPFLNNVLAFFGLSLVAVCFCIYLKIPQRLYIWVLVGLVLTLTPFTFERLYWAHSVAGVFIGFAFCVAGFVVAKKAGEYDKTQKAKSYSLCFISILCLHWALATYPPFLDTLCILLCGGLIVLIVDEKSDLKSAFFKARFIFISIALAALSYKITLDILKKLGVVVNSYNNDLVAIGDLPSNIIAGVKLALHDIFLYDSFSTPISMSVLFAIFIPILLGLLWLLNLKFRTKFVIFILLLGAVIASQTHYMLSAAYNRSDINFTGLLIVRVLIIALAFKFSFELLRIKNLTQNALFVLCVIIIWFCVVLNLHAQRVQKQAFDAEMRLFNQIVYRFSVADGFSYDKKYCGIMFGDMELFRLKYSNHRDYDFKPGDTKFDGYDIYKNSATMRGLLPSGWESGHIYQWFMPKNVFAGCDFYPFSAFKNHKESKKMLSLLKRLDKAGILDTLQPFPHKNSVVVFEDIIVFVASKINLDEIRATIKALETQEIQAQNEDKERQDSQSEKSQEIQKDTK